MRDKRVLATLIIWGAVIYFLQSLTGYSDPPFDGTVALIFVMVTALVSTICVWVMGSEDFNSTPATRLESDKAKRELPADVRLQLLLELLDDKEKARLKSRLLNEFESNVADGEISLEMLLKQ